MVSGPSNATPQYCVRRGFRPRGTAPAHRCISARSGRAAERDGDAPDRDLALEIVSSSRLSPLSSKTRKRSADARPRRGRGPNRPDDAAPRGRRARTSPVTCVSAANVTVHMPVPAQPPPLQPANVDPSSATARASSSRPGRTWPSRSARSRCLRPRRHSPSRTGLSPPISVTIGGGGGGLPNPAVTSLGPLMNRAGRVAPGVARRSRPRS